MKILEKYNGIIIILVFVLIMFTWGWLRNKTLLKNHQLSVAKITNYSYNNGRGQSGISLYFTFELKGRIYESRTEFGYNNLSKEDAQAFFVGKFFPLMYNPNHLENNQILITKKDFQHFNIPFPDSLKWTLKYLHM
jgi:hypothetical protein